MIKKLSILLVLAIGFGFAAFGIVNPTHAQEAESPEMDTATGPEREELAYQFAYSFQLGDQLRGQEPVSNHHQTRTRTQLGEFQGDECPGEGERQQLQIQLGENLNEMRQTRLQLKDGSCNGQCQLLNLSGQ